MTTPISSPVRDRLTGWLRTVVPTLWAALIAWAVARGVLPHALTDWAAGLGETVAVPVVLAAVYAGLRWLESRSWMPAWLVTVLLGSAKTPSYQPSPVVPALAPVVATPVNSGSPSSVEVTAASPDVTTGTNGTPPSV